MGSKDRMVTQGLLVARIRTPLILLQLRLRPLSALLSGTRLVLCSAAPKAAPSLHAPLVSRHSLIERCYLGFSSSFRLWLPFANKSVVHNPKASLSTTSCTCMNYPIRTGNTVYSSKLSSNFILPHKA
jgi:hypothetical protein